MKATGTRVMVAVAVAALLGLAAVPAAAQEAPAILGMAWTETPAPALVVSATGPLQFAESRPAPGVVVLNLAGALPVSAVAPISRSSAGLKEASLGTAADGLGSLLRLEVSPGTTVRVTALPAGIEVRLAAPSEASLDDVLAVADEGGVSILLAGSQPLAGKVFTLPEPDRVVLDLPGVVSRVSRRVQAVESSGVKRVRVSQNRVEPQPVTRVVIDLDRPLPFALETTARGAVLRVGEAPVPAAGVQVAALVEEQPAYQPEPAVLPATSPEPAQVLAAAEATTAEPPLPVPATATRAEVTIVDEPLPERVAEPAPVQAAPAAAPLTAPPVAARRPAAKPADSPWTSTPAALIEQASPQVMAGSTVEVDTQERRFTGEPISLSLKDADVKDVLRTFATITGLNIVVDPGVTGSVTVNLENVPWDQALDLILRINGLDYAVENNVLRVARLDRLRAEKAALAAYRDEEERAKPMRTVTKTLSYAKASEMAALMQSKFLLSAQGEIVVDQRTNTLVIRDIADRLNGVLSLIDTLDTPVPQVVIEARIVETTRTFSRSLGVAWGFTGLGDAAHGTTTGLRFPNNYLVGGDVNLGTAGRNGVITLGFGDILDAFNLDFTLNAAEQQGLAKIVSSPKVTAQNNEKAHIQSGVMIPIQTVANNTVTVQYVNATLSLDVTPQITAEGTIILDINLMKREPLAGINIQEANNVPISTRDAQTRLMVRDGGTTVIGGIYQFNDDSQSSAVPWLGRLPVLGALFRNEQLASKHDELLIFITPRIIKY
jgi:type IV pilus secretin PilQ/predicted competence protein